MQMFSSKQSNYFKAIIYQYAHLQYMNEIKHPALPVIFNCLAAFNEERGEKSIHDAIRYINDSDFSFENLDTHFKLSSIVSPSKILVVLSCKYRKNI